MIIRDLQIVTVKKNISVLNIAVQLVYSKVNYNWTWSQKCYENRGYNGY